MIKHTIQKTFIYLLLVGLFACNAPEIQHQKQPYFSLNNYFDKEITALEKLKPQVNKTVSAGNKNESKRLDNINWKNELEIFKSADINKSSWLGSFKIDSTLNHIRYTALDPKIPTKFLEVQFDGQQNVRAITIIKSVKNDLYETRDSLFYQPKKQYRILTSQKLRLGKIKNYKVAGSFIH